MEHVRFTLPSGRTQTLRPILAEKVAAEIRAGMDFGDDRATARSGALADAAARVRDTYRCRDARRDLRLVSLLAVDGVAARQDVEVSCADAGAIGRMREAAEGR